MKKWWRRKRPYVLSAIVYAIARTIWMTLRLERLGWSPPSGSNAGRIYCGWHGKSFIPANCFKGKGVWALFSLSNDGELQSRIFKRLGFRVIRGSTGRGGARAAIEAIRVLRAGESMAITPDGPKGPPHGVQPGVIVMAQKSGALLIPVGSFAKPAAHVPTWDRYLVPLPFSRAAIVYGEPVTVPESADEAEFEEARRRLEDAIKAAEERAREAIEGATADVSESSERSPEPQGSSIPEDPGRPGK